MSAIWSALLSAALEVMIAGGGAAPGDRTILDTLQVALKVVRQPEADVAAVAVAARRALERFREQPNRIGRARMFGDATVGEDDPGMLAFTLLAEALAVTEQ